MLYMVECAFADPAREDAWNAYYDAEKLAVLLSLPGFLASQRFRAVQDTPAPYLAVHSVRDADVFGQAEYRAQGGGTFDGWDALVTNWRRNLFAGMEVLPDVPADACLVLCDDPEATGTTTGLEFAWLDIAGLDRSVARRGVGIVDRETGTRLAREADSIIRVFAPVAGRHVPLRGSDG